MAKSYSREPKKEEPVAPVLKVSYANGEVAESADPVFLKSNAACKLSVGVRSVVAVPTGMLVEVPEGYEFKVVPLDPKIEADSALGTIDSGYHEEVVVRVGNSGDFPYEILPGNPVASGFLSPLAAVKDSPAVEVPPAVVEPEVTPEVTVTPEM